MRNTLFSIFILLIVVSSCKKNDNNKVTATTTTTSSDTTVLTGNWVVINSQDASAYRSLGVIFYYRYRTLIETPTHLAPYSVSGDTLYSQVIDEGVAGSPNYCRYIKAGDTLYLHSFFNTDSITLARVY